MDKKSVSTSLIEGIGEEEGVSSQKKFFPEDEEDKSEKSEKGEKGHNEKTPHHRAAKIKDELFDMRFKPETEEEIVQSVCQGSRNFCFMFFLCICLGIALPVILIPIGYEMFDVTSTSAIILYCVGGGFFLLCCCWCCISIQKAIFGALCLPPRPEPAEPFVNLTSEVKAAGKLEVKKLYIIVNPYGGGGKAKELLKIALKIWDERKIEYTILETERAGHAIEMAHYLDLEGYDGLCIIGGDGSFHELINGYLNRTDGKQIVLGLIPGGSGNSILGDFGSPDVKEAAIRIADGHFCFMDANRVELSDNAHPIFSVNMIALGLFADIGVLGEEFRWLGVNRYFYVSLWIILKRMGVEVKMDFDGEKLEAQIVTFTINLTQHFGNQVRVSPHARLDDDKMDLVLIKDASRGEMINMFIQTALGRTKNEDPKGLRRQAKAISIVPKDPGVMNVDGELYSYRGGKEIKLTSVPKAFAFFTPSKILKDS